MLSRLKFDGAYLILSDEFLNLPDYSEVMICCSSPSPGVFTRAAVIYTSFALEVSLPVSSRSWPIDFKNDEFVIMS